MLFLVINYILFFVLCMYLSKIFILMSMEQLLLLFKLFRLISKDKLCSASFMFDESFYGGGWWLFDFTSATFRFILFLVGGHLTHFLILLDSLWEVFFSFSLRVLDGELLTENSEIEFFQSDNWELKIEDSEMTLSLSINEYRGRELFTHSCIKFSSKPFEDWDCALRDLPFTLFGKHSFRRFQCSTRVAFSVSN